MLLRDARVFTATILSNTNEGPPKRGRHGRISGTSLCNQINWDVHLKCTCSVKKPRAKLARFILLFDCKVMSNRVFFTHGGAFSGILRKRRRRTLRVHLQRAPLGRGETFWLTYELSLNRRQRHLFSMLLSWKRSHSFLNMFFLDAL